MPDPLKTKLEEAWLLRVNQRIYEAEVLLSECKAIARKNPPETPEFVVDLLLLEASIERSRRNVKRSNELIAEAEKLVRAYGMPDTYQLSFQSGLNLYLACDYTQAINRFLAARAASRSDLERAAALSNLILCLEALGLPGAEIEKEFRKLLLLLGSEPDTRWLSNDLRAYDLRCALRQGKFSQVLGKQRDLAAELSQEDYYRLWVAELPFHSARKASDFHLTDFALGNPSFPQKAYRLRTLQMLLHPEDLENFKVTEFADRVYLWVWKWLVDPRFCPLERIVQLLEKADFKQLSARVTAEDYQMLRNSLRWLGLFDATSSLHIQKLTRSLQLPHVRDFPLFEFESLAIDYLTALRDRKPPQAPLEKLKAHPLWSSREYLLASLITELAAEDPGKIRTLPLLRENLLALTKPGKKSAQAALAIDLSSWEVKADTGLKTISEPVCLAFYALKNSENLGFGEFLKTAFGLSKYEPELHNAKILNLLARMRELVPPSLSLTTKQGRVYASGSWSGISFANLPGETQREHSQINWRSLAEKGATPSEGSQESRWAKSAPALKQLRERGGMSRKELEEILGKSRATANRVIARWIEQGVITASGTAKNTRYELKEK